jgi:hypothetical protein
MKLSVSVPDELWERAQMSRPDLNNSRLVQEALDQLTRPASSAGFSLDRPATAEEGFAKAKEQFATLARAEFERGYQAAVDLAPSLGWWNLQRLAESHFYVKGWVSSYMESYIAGEIGNIPKQWAPDGELIPALLKAFGNLVAPFGDDTWGPSIPYLRGAAQALRELWTAVNAGDTTPSESDDQDVEGAPGP